MVCRGWTLCAVAVYGGHLFDDLARRHGFDPREKRFYQAVLSEAPGCGLVDKTHAATRIGLFGSTQQRIYVFDTVLSFPLVY